MYVQSMKSGEVALLIDPNGKKKKLMLYITAVVILSKIKYFSSRSCLGVYDFHIICFYDFYIFIFLLSLLPFESFIGHREHIRHDMALITFLINRLTLFVTVKPLLDDRPPFSRSTHPFSKIPPF